MNSLNLEARAPRSPLPWRRLAVVASLLMAACGVCDDEQAPRITRDPVTVTVDEGDTASFVVDVNGPPPLTYQWRRESIAVAGANSPIFEIARVAATDFGSRIDVVVSNPHGAMTSQSARLLVRPTIVTQPQSVAVVAGQSATFTVQATASPGSTLVYRWERDAVPIDGATSPTYRTPALTQADEGAKFRVHVSKSDVGVYSSDAVVAVTAAP